MTWRRARGSGFSLLEVVVALAILAVSLMAIFDLNAGAIASHAYVKRLTIAALLARSKMTDLEQKLYDKGFQNDDEEDAGDFTDEGWPSFKWRARIIAPRTNGMTPQQLIGGLFNLPMGDGKDGSDPLGPLGPLFGGGGKDGKGGPDLGALAGGGGAGGALAGLGPMAGMMQGQFTAMVDQLTKAVREVHLTVTWKDGKQTESLDLVTHVVSMGPGTDRNGGPVAGVNGAPPASTWVNQNTGAPVPNPTTLPDGRMVDPSDGQTPVVTIQTWAAMNAARSRVGAGGLDPSRAVPQLRLPGMAGGALEKRPVRVRNTESDE